MSPRSGTLTPEALEIIQEEEALLQRVLTALERGRERAARAPAVSDLRAVERLRALREEAASASADDLPPLLLEMSVCQRLLERPAQAPLPEPRCPYLRCRVGASSRRRSCPV